MPTALVLITAAQSGIGDAIDGLSDMSDVTEVYSVAGEYDLVATVQVEEYERFAEVIPERLQTIDGVETTQTLMAFKTYQF
ncbi:MAG: Lrp/AsnC family transcriptional regulator [Halobacteriaceae archaeon]